MHEKLIPNKPQEHKSYNNTKNIMRISDSKDVARQLELWATFVTKWCFNLVRWNNRRELDFGAADSRNSL